MIYLLNHTGWIVLDERLYVFLSLIIDDKIIIGSVFLRDDMYLSTHVFISADFNGVTIHFFNMMDNTPNGTS